MCSNQASFSSWHRETHKGLVCTDTDIDKHTSPSESTFTRKPNTQSTIHQKTQIHTQLNAAQ